MQDRYLFRGKRIDNGEWEIGYLYCTQNHAYISNDHADMVEVDKDTICQCTGLKDKTSRLIFENDIIECKFGKAVVIWDKSEWRIKWIDDLVWRKDLHYWATDNGGKIEVIGNRFDNPELLEVQE